MDNNIINKRTAGQWEYGYGDNSKAFGIFTKKMLDEGLEEHPICLISPIELMNDTDKANAAFICKTVNNYDSLLSALKELTEITRWVEDNYEKGCGHLAKLERAEAAIKQAETN